jgi:tetratricopeptide (TPR) repeat protein
MSSEAAVYLKHARAFRARAEVAEALEYAQAAYQLAVDAGDGETAYRSRAAIGHMFMYRAEYAESFRWYELALDEAHAWSLAEWIPAAHHDCWLSGSEAGLSKPELAPHGAAASLFPAGPCRRISWRFVHDHAWLRHDGGAERARFLASAALTAAWCAVQAAPPGGDEYAAYAARLDRMISCASMVQGFGACRMLEQWLSATKLFDVAADALGTDEAFALCLLSCADGTWRIGDTSQAECLRARAARVAHDRAEAAVLALADGLAALWRDSRASGGKA